MPCFTFHISRRILSRLPAYQRVIPSTLRSRRPQINRPHRAVRKTPMHLLSYRIFSVICELAIRSTPQSLPIKQCDSDSAATPIIRRVYTCGGIKRRHAPQARAAAWTMLPHRDCVGDVGSAWDGRQVERPASSASDRPRMPSARLPPHPPCSTAKPFASPGPMRKPPSLRPPVRRPPAPVEPGGGAVLSRVGVT